jgi:hypothetical protein
MATSHRPRLLGGLRPTPQDPSESSNPEIRRLLAGLAALPSPTPSATFRTELRTQLVAVAPRLIAEGEPSTEKAPAQPRSSALGSLARLRKPATILLTVATVFVVLLGGAVFLSGKALPGSSLYGVKRASEDVQLSLSTSDADKGKQYLNMAGTRADEVSDLLGDTSAMAAGSATSASGAVNAHTAKLVTSTLDDQDSQTQSGARLLNADSLRTASATPLTTLINWAPAQQTRMQAIIARIPAGALHDRAVASEAVLTAALARSQALAPLVASPCEATTSSDAYGPIPVVGCTPSTPVSSGATPTPKVSVPGGGSGGSGGAGTTGTGTGGVSVPTLPAGTGLLPTQVPTLPTGGGTGLLPTTTPSLPITTGTCGVGVNLPPLITLGVGTCGISVGVGG